MTTESNIRNNNENNKLADEKNCVCICEWNEKLKISHEATNFWLLYYLQVLKL
jgi:hypothetical protein